MFVQERQVFIALWRAIAMAMMVYFAAGLGLEPQKMLLATIDTTS